jgi:DNA-binding transcriptional ArsR family regulator
MAMDGYERLAVTMKALSHPVRLQILEALRQEEACVCHLENLLGQRQAYISQQLARLREAGLVVDRRDGMNVFYRLAAEALGPLLDMARTTTIAIAQVEGRALTFHSLEHDPSIPCPCPKCGENERVALG